MEPGQPRCDGLMIQEVANNPRKYLYPLWNRMASGSYFPKPVKEVLIPKGKGKMRPLGIPTVIDRVAQQVVATELESLVEKGFSPNSFGYRPNKSAHDAIAQCRKHCFRYSWVIDLDIKGFYDNINHELLLKAVSHHTKEKYILLYVERWLKASVQKVDGSLHHPKGKGTPQGGVISPVLANIFMDIAFDKRFERHYPKLTFERYADDIVIHCYQQKQAHKVLNDIRKRLSQCKLELHPDKTRVVYCRRNQKKRPQGKVAYQSFDFLGHTFKPRIVRKGGKLFLGFTPSMSQKSISRINEELFRLNLHKRTQSSIEEIAGLVNSKIMGWIRYYGKFRLSGMCMLYSAFHRRLAKWLRNKYRRYHRKPWVASRKYLRRLSKYYPMLFEHWKHPSLRP
ncbi:group II intron reverse transcriptase/maturase [Salegentibacter sp. JZCK2]|uniref:group II intron reverse transcriptase/maturase n=1 Tax=Salegentibacter tibetensis TaxID=2873600 RepID=UPI001CCC04C8|nr:group II intron reverse transcriptase/maturase [Salegentibacter tibetensis]MBZ9731543.1 group II intron reverse transcriptase/maturase [Salegentibacter tibetensis]